MKVERNHRARMARSRSSKFRLLLVIGAMLNIAVAVGYLTFLIAPISAYATTQSVVAFDFDTGAPPPSLYQNTPFDYLTSSGVTAHFSSPSDYPGAPAFSVYDTAQGYNLSMFSGKWLYDNRLSSDYLDIKFNADLHTINVTFAILEPHGGPSIEPCYINLTAYMNSTETNPVGWTWTRGVTSSELNSQGMLSLNSINPFNLVRIGIPPGQPAPVSVTDFFIDNIVIMADPSNSTSTGNIINISLFGSASAGWGFASNNMTSPGPTIVVNKGDLVNLTLIGVDALPHNFFVDYNKDGTPSPDEPTSPTFQTTTINYQFNASTAGDFTYYCQFHPSIMRGSFVVGQSATLPTDLNGDGVVNIVDISIVAKAFGSKSTDPNWNEKADLDKNGQVNIVDVSRIAKDIGKAI